MFTIQTSKEEISPFLKVLPQEPARKPGNQTLQRRLKIRKLFSSSMHSVLRWPLRHKHNLPGSGSYLVHRQGLMYGREGQSPVTPFETIVHRHELVLELFPSSLRVRDIDSIKAEHFAALRGCTHAVWSQSRLGQGTEALPGGRGCKTLCQAVIGGKDGNGSNVLHVYSTYHRSGMLSILPA